MKGLKEVLLFTSLCFIGVVASFLVNFNVITPMVTGDLDKYYNQDKADNGIIYNIFFDINSSTGYLPEPSMINWTLTLLIGLTLGLTAYYIIKKNNIYAP